MTTVTIQSPKTLAPEIEKKSRFTFEEALKEVVANSKLKELMESDDPSSGWVEATTADIEAANIVLKKFEDDMFLVLERHIEIERIDLSAEAKKGYGNAKDRIEALYKAFKLKVLGTDEEVNPFFKRDSLSKIIGRFLVSSRAACPDARVPFDPAEKKWYLPISEIKTEGTNVSFDYIDGNQVRYRVTFADHSIKHPEDFTRQIPQRIQRRIGVLERTNFEYIPRIVDGYLLGKEYVDHYSGMDSAKSFLEEKEDAWRDWAIDPALSIEVCGDRKVIDFWQEPDEQPMSSTVQAAFAIIFGMTAIAFAWFSWSIEGWYFKAGLLLLGLMGFGGCFSGVVDMVSHYRRLKKIWPIPVFKN